MEFLFVWVLVVVCAYKFGKRRGRAEAEAMSAKDGDESLIDDTTEADLRDGRTGVSIIGVQRPHKD